MDEMPIRNYLMPIIPRHRPRQSNQGYFYYPSQNYIDAGFSRVIVDAPNGTGVFNRPIQLMTVVTLDGDVSQRRRVASNPISRLTNNDDNSNGDIDANLQSNRRQLVAHQGSYLFLEAFLLLLCRARYRNVEMQNSLFDFMRDHLQQLNVLQPLDTNEAITTLRDQCCHTLNELMLNYQMFSELPSRTSESGGLTSARDTYLERLIVNNPVLSMVRDWAAYSLFCAPRYRSEYEQFEQLGKGGYGRVYRVRSKMDKREYAVKKIHLSSKNPKCFSNVQREVEVFARLKHSNIVEYVTSWLEHSHNSDSFDSSQSTTSSSGTNDESGSALGQNSQGDELNDAENECMNNDAIEELTETIAECDPFVLSDEYDRRSSNLNMKQVINALPPSSAANVDENEQSKKSKGFVATLYIQMELCSRTLFDWLEERNKPVTMLRSEVRFSVVNLDDSNSIFRQILSGVEYIHFERLMHRDLNPKNIFVNENQRVKIGDFGLARPEWRGSVEELSDSPPTPLAIEMTSDVGTTMYSAPEQLDGSYYDQKADIYSLGLIKFELFYPLGTNMERAEVISGLRRFNGYTEETDLLKEWFLPQVEYIRTMLDPTPLMRPSASDLVVMTSKSKKNNEEKDSLVSIGTQSVDDRKKRVKVSRTKSRLTTRSCIRKKDNEIERLKRALVMSRYRIARLKRNVKLLSANDLPLI